MRIGVDFGGTKIEAAAMAPDGALGPRRRIATPGDYDAALNALADLVRETAEAAGGATHVGVAIPGSASPTTGLVRNANTQFLNGRRFDADLAAVLGLPVRIANDANCFALSEAADGAGAGARSVFGVILGTGCGGGLVLDGRIHPGATGLAGEWGHTPLPWAGEAETPGPSCWCGRRGCLETWISGPAVRAWAGREAPILANHAAARDATAVAALAALADRIARGLAVVIDVLDPEVIVLGGGLSNIGALYPLIERRLPRHVFSDAYAPNVRKNLHGDSSGVRGAAWLWPAPP